MFEDFFIERITSLRNQKNVSAREMSLAIGQNPSYINRIENGKTFPLCRRFFIFASISIFLLWNFLMMAARIHLKQTRLLKR